MAKAHAGPSSGTIKWSVAPLVVAVACAKSIVPFAPEASAMSGCRAGASARVQQFVTELRKWQEKPAVPPLSKSA